MKSMNYKQIEKNNKIVYANWFLRQGEAIWDFLYFHVLPIKTWYKVCSIKDQIRYAFERTFTGFDRRISWGYESSIAFYKQLLSDLIKNASGYPPNLQEICPDEWQEVENKWRDIAKIYSCKQTVDLLYMESTEEIMHEFSDDCYNCWIKYLTKVLHYFNEADPETCSKKKNELYGKIRNPFDESKRKVVEHNGNLFYQYPPLGDSEEDKEQQKILDELNNIDKYQIEQLKLGMNEVAKNIIYLND